MIEQERSQVNLNFEGQFITRGGKVSTASHPEHPGVEGRTTWDAHGNCPGNQSLDLMTRVRPIER